MLAESKKVSCGISKLRLINFRNHADLDIKDLSHDVNFVCGANGAGKTNILESLSLLSPGKGIRNAKPSEILINEYPQDIEYKEWAFITQVASNTEINISYVQKPCGSEMKLIKEDSNILKSSRLLLNRVKIVWFIPQMSHLFINASEDRRKFLDRMVYNHFPSHAFNIIQYKKLVRSRMKILKSYNYLEHLKWLETLEWQISEFAEQIVLKRICAIEKIAKSLVNDFDWKRAPVVRIKSDSFYSEGDGFCKEKFYSVLASNRKRDVLSGRTNAGPHTDDIEALHGVKPLEAKYCSTGEQKNIIIKMILAHVKVLKEESDLPVVLLFDDVFAHIDEENRFIIMDAIYNTDGVQKWITGTHQDLKFVSEIEKKCEFRRLDL